MTEGEAANLKRLYKNIKLKMNVQANIITHFLSCPKK